MILRNAMPGSVYYCSEYDAYLFVLETNDDKPDGTIPVIDKDNCTFAFQDDRTEVRLVGPAVITINSESE